MSNNIDKDIEKAEVEFSLKVLSNVMLNFEDKLCDKMQERVEKVKKYIEKQQSELAIKDKMIDSMADYIAEKSNFCANKCCMNEDCHDNDCIKEHFRKEAESNEYS